MLIPDIIFWISLTLAGVAGFGIGWIVKGLLDRG